MIKKTSILSKFRIKKLNYGLLLPVFILCIVGLLSLYVALYYDSFSSGAIFKELVKQGTWYFLGFLIALFIFLLNPKFLWKLTPYFYIFCLIILVLLLKYYNKDLANSTGAKNWFYIAGFSFQPTELVKIGYILMLAKLAVEKQNIKVVSVKTDWIFVGKMIFVTLPIAILLFLQNDLGTMLVFVAIFMFILFVSGINYKVLIPILLIGLCSISAVLFLVVSDSGREILMKIGFHEYQFRRIDIWLDPFSDVADAGFQTARGLMAISSGGLLGKGFNVSEVYVPVRESDMIFTVIGENFGFLGTTLVILIYFYLIYHMYIACFKSNNLFFTYIGIGIVAMIFFHVFENIGANIGLLPLTGIPLPYVSQGGSAIISNFIGLGLMLCCSKFEK